MDILEKLTRRTFYIRGRYYEGAREFDYNATSISGEAATEIKELRAIVRSANGQLESSYAPLQSFASISSNAKRLAVLKRALEDSE